MDENRILLTIMPSGGDDGPIEVSDFLKQVDALKRLVNFAAVSGDVDARVVGLSMNSPACIELEACRPKSNEKVYLNAFFHDVYNVVESGATPISFSREIFDAVKDFASVVGKGVSSSIIKTANDEIRVDITAKDRIDGIFGRDYARDGTIDGMLEAVNIHGKVNNCALYPITGPNRVSCRFEEKLFKQVRPALGRYVLVDGSLKYRWRDKFPHEATISRLEVLPKWEDQPTFAEILGLAPEATGGLVSEDFSKAARNGW